MTSKQAPDPSSRSAAYRAAIRLLEHRDRSIKDLQRRLESRGYDASTVSDTIDRLRREGFLDDRRFAERYVESVRAGRGHGSHRLRAELVRKGVDRDLALAATNLDPEQEADLARELAKKRAAGLPAGLSREVAMRRLAGFLGRKGFPAETVWAAARHAIEGRE